MACARADVTTKPRAHTPLPLPSSAVRLSDWARRDVPEAWLQRDYLPRFKPE